MKNSVLILALILWSSLVFGQQDLTLFQFSGVPQANLVSPSVIPDNKFVIGLPVLSSVNSIYNNRIFSIDESLLSADGTLTIDPTKIVSDMDERNFINAQVQDQWFLFGMTYKNHYFKLGVSEKLAVDLSFSRKLFDFLLRGNASYLGERVDIQNTAFNATHYREVSLGYANKLNEKWEVGGHLNLLFGLANINTRNSTIAIYTDPENYDITISGNVEVNTSGINDLQGNTIDYLQQGSNFGLGMDLGATFHPTPKWDVSLSLLDLGYINWNNDLTTYTNNGKTFKLTGIDIKDFFGDDNLDGDSLINEIVDSIGDVFTLDEIEKKYTTTLAPKVYIGGKYLITEQHRVYTTLMFQFYSTGLRTGLSLGYEFDLNKFLGVTANYSIYSNSFTNFGLGLRVRGGPVQLYVITDSMIGSFDAFSVKSVHFRFGINILIDEKEKSTVKNNLL